MVCAALLLKAAVALADDAAAEPMSVRLENDRAPLEPWEMNEPWEMKETRGVVLHGTYVVDTFGKAIPVLIDFQWAGIRTFSDDKYLVVFDAAAGATAGYGGNSYPTFLFFGGHLRGQVDGGLRLKPSNAVSPYVGLSALLDASAVAITTAPINQYDRVNPVDGLAGLNQASALRANVGLSNLWRSELNGTPKQALLVTLFAEEALRRPGRAPSAMFFTDVGVHAQLDLLSGPFEGAPLTASLDALWGTAFTRTDTTFQETHLPTHFKVTASVRKHFGRVWLAIDGLIHADGDTVTSLTTKNTYVTSTPVWASAGLSFGVSL